MARYIVTALIESDDDSLEGWSIRAVDFKYKYVDNVIESAVIKVPDDER